MRCRVAQPLTSEQFPKIKYCCLYDRTWPSAISIHWRTARDSRSFSLFAYRAVQRFNAVLIHETFDTSKRASSLCQLFLINFYTLFLAIGSLLPPAIKK